MPSRSLPVAVLQEMIEAVRQHGSVTAAADALGINRATADSRWQRAKIWGEANGVDLPQHGARGVKSAGVSRDSTVVTGDTCEISRVTPSRVKTLADLVRVCEIDQTEWEVERYTCNKWDMGSVPPMVGSSESGWTREDGATIITELFQIKAWLKRKVVIVAARSEICALIADAKTRIPARATRARIVSPSGNLLEPSIPDLHVGKLAWALETGWENYDTRTAEKVFEEALSVLVARTESYRPERILFPIGNDVLHADTKQGTTTAGTPLDMDSRYHKSFLLVRQMMTRAIDTLRSIAPVHVVVVPGNHDTLGAWHLGDSLECYFHSCADVTIDNAPSMRKYYQWGKVMLMLTHGNRGKLADYPMVMAAEQPKMFGETIHREAHTGDKHQLKVQEVHGVRVRISPALCPPDAWHSEHHFVGNARSAEAFVWHREEGLIGTAHYTVAAPKRKGA